MLYLDGRRGSLVPAVIALSNHPDAFGKIFNIGSDQEIEVISRAEKIKEITDSSSPIMSVPYEDAYEFGFEDMDRRVPNLSRIRQRTGYKPTKTLDEMLPAISAGLEKREHPVHSR